MRLKNIASGSSGNATYVGTESTHILIDSGISKKRIIEGLRELQLTMDDITAILITHEHSDHISSLGIIERTKTIPLYATAGTRDAMLNYKTMQGLDCGLFRQIKSGESFTLGDILITPLSTHHDAAEPVCYRFDSLTGSGLQCSSCAVVTDLGDYTPELRDSLKGLDAILAEANHDVRMLEVGPYPYPLKMRILSENGHLSNERSGMLISELLNDNTKHIILGHLSRENNTPDLAKLTVESVINESPVPYAAGDFDIEVADRITGTEIFEF